MVSIRGSTAKYVASHLGSTNKITLLLDYKANPNLKGTGQLVFYLIDINGWTPLHKAVLSGNPEAILMLSDRGAEPDIADKEGNTPMHLATEEGNHGNLYEVKKKLIRGSSNVDKETRQYGS